MRRTNPDGQLGNVSMARIDALSVRQLHDLDLGLASFVHHGYPHGRAGTMGAASEIAMIQSTFSAAGIAVRAREIGNDVNYDAAGLVQRVRLARAICHQYQDGRKPNDYSLTRHTNAQMFETLVETCRYRGLFNSEGNCISVEEVNIRKAG
jgi:hypothetical protein